ncbi:MAG: hypothetical protein OES57_13595, partial [Acidimicrobiia bacterium]|nr:hypothetical protein [Acidimicrobiia bacterium]
MTESSLSKDPFVRRTALTAGIIALVVLVIAGAAYLLTRSSDDADFTVRIGMVSPTDANRMAPSLVGCPTDERAESPLPDSTLEPSLPPVERAGFGVGQVVAYNLGVEVASGAPDTARFVVRFSDAFDPGVVCTFVAVEDPSHAESADTVVASWRDASAAEPAGQLELSGVSPADVVVVQLWAVLSADERPTRQATVSVTPGVDTDVAPVSRTDRVALGMPVTATGDPTVTIDDGLEPAVLGQSFTTTYTVSNETTAVLNRVGLVAGIDEGARVEGARVDDTSGHPTQCNTRDGELLCQLGFLSPGESVVIEATVAVDTTAVSFWGRDAGPCDRDEQQDLCQRAELTWAGPFSPDTLEVTEVTNVDDAAVFAVLATSQVDTGYALGTVNVDILVTTDVAAAEITEVSTTGCPMATYAAGDVGEGPGLAAPVFATDGDGILGAGELWLFTCGARQYTDGIIEVVVAGSAAGVPARTVRQVEIEVIDPMLIVSRADGPEVTWSVTNAGDVPLVTVAVAADGCDPMRTDA